jgi:2-keto-3-deoxy-L-rhamnonate aldolase RhmA
MTMSEPSLREQLCGGDVKLCFAIMGGGPAIVEIAGLAGCQSVWLEVEHAGTDLMYLEHLCRAAELHGMWPLIRVADGSRPSVLRALEIGGRIIVTPQINTPEQAAAVVEYGKFAPVGNRGYNPGSRGMRYGAWGADEVSMPAANRYTCLLVQIESVEALDNAEAIIATEGLDGVLVGPGDLSATMGRPGQFNDPELLDAVEHVISLARRHNEVAATTTPSPELVRRAKAAGVSLLVVGIDTGMLLGALRARLDEVRAM